MRGLLAFVLCMFAAGSCLSCSVNVLETFADKNSDEALLIEAKRLINDGSYTEAIAKLALMTGALASDRDTISLKASAYAGICGVRFLTFVEDLSNMGTTRLFPFLAGEFTGATGTKIDACRAAEDLIESIGTVSERTSDENMRLVLISFAKIGNILSLYTDANQDGNPDAGVNPCTETPRASRPASAVAGDWYTSDLRELGTGITLAIANISAVSGTVDLGSASLTDINTACSDLGTLNPAYNFCSVTDPSAFTASQLKGIKSMLKEDSSVGLGTDCTGDVSACNCP